MELVNGNRHEPFTAGAHHDYSPRKRQQERGGVGHMEEAVISALTAVCAQRLDFSGACGRQDSFLRSLGQSVSF